LGKKQEDFFLGRSPFKETREEKSEGNLGGKSTSRRKNPPGVKNPYINSFRKGNPPFRREK